MSIAFDSRKNYLKQFMQGSVAMNKPNTLAAGTYSSSHTITHNLGYRPLVRAWYDPENLGTIFPVNSQRGELYSPIYALGTVDFVFFIDEITTTTVTFRAEDNASHSSTFTMYYKIYIDPVAS
jgi:hypothetical protein